MRSFHTIAVPHKDVLEGRLTMDVFAADLWEVSQNRGPDEYKDTDTFFRKTYMTQGLDNLLALVEKRLHGRGGDPVIQIQTPFGGGKTHALIAMYHKAAEWNAKKAVIVGTALSKNDTLWELMEEQLAGKATKLSGKTTPGRKALREMLYDNQPVLILMDELLEYVTKAATVKVEESNLGAQTMAFMQELTETAGTLEKVCLAITLPSSILEHYDESAERLYQQLQKVAGRIEKIYTPVQENEIAQIIRRRLFSDLEEYDAKEVVTEFIEYAEKEELLPAGVQPSEYRDRFLDSYPFMPEVIDVLYHRWGSFPSFQRTRGVLRLLSLVIHSLKETNRSYISLADFDLANQEIRQELLNHIGSEYNSVIAADITDTEAGSKKVDQSLGKSYQGLNLGTRTATTMFLHSFSGGEERGITTGEIKRFATTTENSATVVTEAVEQLKNRLFYLQNIGDKQFFSNQPNLNRIRQIKMENIKPEELVETEKELLRRSIKGNKLKSFVWKEKPSDIADSEQLKLVILREKNESLMESIEKTKGQSTRIYPNTLFFLYPMESERTGFVNTMKEKIARERIKKDETLNLSDDQKKENRERLKNAEDDLKESIRRVYRMVAIPQKDGFEEINLGIHTWGENKGIDQEVYEKLRSDGEILEKIAPLVITTKYLSDKKYVSTKQLYESSLKTPGEKRLANKPALKDGIAEGIRGGSFGLGILKEGKSDCQYFKEQASVEFSDDEIIISEELCEKPTHSKGEIEVDVIKPFGIDEDKEVEVYIDETNKKTGGCQSYIFEDLDTGTYSIRVKIDGEIEHSKPIELSEDQTATVTVKPPRTDGGDIEKVNLKKFEVPKGKVASLMGIMNLLQSKFDTLEVEISAKDGKISKQNYEGKIEETFRQMGIDLDS